MYELTKRFLGKSTPKKKIQRDNRQDLRKSGHRNADRRQDFLASKALYRKHSTKAEPRLSEKKHIIF